MANSSSVQLPYTEYHDDFTNNSVFLKAEIRETQTEDLFVLKCNLICHPLSNTKEKLQNKTLTLVIWVRIRHIAKRKILSQTACCFLCLWSCFHCSTLISSEQYNHLSCDPIQLLLSFLPLYRAPGETRPTLDLCHQLFTFARPFTWKTHCISAASPRVSLHTSSLPSHNFSSCFLSLPSLQLQASSSSPLSPAAGMLTAACYLLIKVNLYLLKYVSFILSVCQSWWLEQWSFIQSRKTLVGKKSLLGSFRTDNLSSYTFSSSYSTYLFWNVWVTLMENYSSCQEA